MAFESVQSVDRQVAYCSLSKMIYDANELMRTDLSQLLRAARAGLDLSQREVARRSKLSEATIRRLERSTCEAAPATLKRIVEFFECQECEFILPDFAAGTWGIRFPYVIMA